MLNSKQKSIQAMATPSKSKAGLIVPLGVQRRAGIKTSDPLAFKVSRHTITITVKPTRVYRPTRAELTSIRKGEAEIAKGEIVPLSEILDALEHSRSKSGKKTARKASR